MRIKLPATKTLWTKLALALALASAMPARAESDIDGPAGDLPDAGEADAAAPPAAPAAPAPGAKAAKSAKAAKDGEESHADHDDKDDDSGSTQVTWDSYSDLGKSSSVAREVTGGVRVEDIVEPPSDYRYAAFGKGDPFVPPLLARELEKEQGASALEIPLVSPLQCHDLGALSLVGIWQLKSGERKAMVMTPAGECGPGAGVIVKNGDLIGKRGGKILGIGDDYLNIREFSLAPDGSRRFEDRQMFMGKRNDDDLAGKIRFQPGVSKTEIIRDSADGRIVQAPAAEAEAPLPKVAKAPDPKAAAVPPLPQAAGKQAPAAGAPPAKDNKPAPVDAAAGATPPPAPIDAAAGAAMPPGGPAAAGAAMPPGGAPVPAGAPAAPAGAPAAVPALPAVPPLPVAR